MAEYQIYVVDFDENSSDYGRPDRCVETAFSLEEAQKAVAEYQRQGLGSYYEKDE